MSNRPLHLIQEGCDAGILPGKITDESVIARPAGKITLYLAASPALVKSRPAVKEPPDLKSWPWIGLSGIHFWSAKEIKLFAGNRAEQTLHLSPVLISEGVTSIRAAVGSRPGDIRASGTLDSGRPAFRAARARPTAVELERHTDSCRLCRISPIADARTRFRRLAVNYIAPHSHPNGAASIQNTERHWLISIFP
jgi:hypothetical protein